MLEDPHPQEKGLKARQDHNLIGDLLLRRKICLQNNKNSNKEKKRGELIGTGRIENIKFIKKMAIKNREKKIPIRVAAGAEVNKMGKVRIIRIKIKIKGQKIKVKEVDQEGAVAQGAQVEAQIDNQIENQIESQIENQQTRIDPETV